MDQAAYVAVDWGTSSFRLWLMSADHQVLAERRSGEGMTVASARGFPEVLESHLTALSAPADLPVIICGMAGARQGWVEAGYVDVPAPLAAVTGGAVTVSHPRRDIRILPGIAARLKETPDVMRGEETQLLGAARAASTADAGDHLVCMPGTHSKWVRVEDGTVTAFSTFMTGEIFDILSKHSILSHAVAEAGGVDGNHPAFLSAVGQALAQPAMLTNLLFTVRSGQLLHGLDATSAAARLSGLLIGAEIAGGLSLSRAKIGSDGQGTVQLVASGRLQTLYEAALSACGMRFETIDADVAVRRGLSVAAETLILSHKGHHA
ncbi:2-dehydro-3-deoxygalactonokinase [Rhizobium sp. SSA_523]|uniref:2-dehydro-3-deoxygalactonokinase n=1 Tax=Rhizobium sp. SSA_523 TaxID=2952477 RepID=UPI002090F5A1|nr:2-dehydro-3-deoxygalactonokinase [Rhizobium sp. SSA_523]MCO5731130.1 2-dehydro-3-deoxygalactonokinase [Rhizobium sp. SSA_523]WKC24075.1 2-dehydro-3-deoxygalactonokinase [Rhizobium sp. SSA_523]